MYDQLWLENPKVQRIRTEGRKEGIAVGKAEGIAEGIAEGVETLQRTLITFINVRFPALSEVAQQKVPHIKHLSQLELLAQQMYMAPDEHIARFLLNPTEK